MPAAEAARARLRTALADESPVDRDDVVAVLDYLDRLVDGIVGLIDGPAGPVPRGHAGR